MSPKFYCEGKFIAIFLTEKVFLFYVNSTVTQETRLEKGVCASRAAKRITFCVNLLMNLKNPRHRESLVTLEKKRKNVLQDLKLPSTRSAICLWVRCCVCTSDVFGISVAIIFVLESTGSILYFISAMKCY